LDIFLARQPIFDCEKNVKAYELLYRSGTTNAADADGDSATSSVIINSLVIIGLDNITDGKLAFVNFTRNLLVENLATVFDPKSVILEVLENIEPDEDLIAALRELKSKGYKIALDDFVEDFPHEELIALADIIKVDFVLSDEAAIKRIPGRFKGKHVAMLAEKVETQEQFELATALGYTLFQGYFFAKPNMVSSKDIKSIQHSHVRILKELAKSNPDFAKIGVAIETDLALSFKLLKLANSIAFGSKHSITSIKDALVRLGLQEIRKWVALIMLRDTGNDKPEELVRASLIRARAMELCSHVFGHNELKTEFFLAGLFSMIDSIVDKPLEIVLAELSLSDLIKDALMGKKNEVRILLELIIAYEHGYWSIIDDICGHDKVKFDSVSTAYYDALKWTDTILSGKD
jgi:c-di-GMP-related signal transduction protein